MSETIFLKFNNLRRPEFATRTIIEEDEGVRRVVKSALSKEGLEHIHSFPEKAGQLKALYGDIAIVPLQLKEDKVYFDYISGRSIGGILEESLGDKKLAVKSILKYSRMIEDYSPDMITDFYPCDEYAEVFGDTYYEGDAVRISNVDEIFDNYILNDGGLSLIDYEWVFDFPVPVRFIRFRRLYYFYTKNHGITGKLWDEEEYLGEFGYEPAETKLWKEAEDHFQQYVHGEDRRYFYTQRYEGKIRDINYLLNNVPDIAKEYNDLAVLSKEAEQLRHDIMLKHYPKRLIRRFKEKLGR